MNRSFRAAVFLCLSALLLTLTAFADMGPKAQLIVRVTNKPEEPYYLDLLAQDSGGSLHESLSGEERAALDPALYRALLSAVPEGWHACLAQGTSGAPIWSREGLAGEDGVHTFYYHGVPRTYRILIVTQSGETFLSEVYTRSALQSSAAVDWSPPHGIHAAGVCGLRTGAAFHTGAHAGAGRGAAVAFWPLVPP